MSGTGRRRRVWIAGIPVALLTLLVGCSGAESRFCSDLRQVDRALGAVRGAKAQDDFERVPDLMDEVADAYEGVAPPVTLKEDWGIAVEFFRRQGESARILLVQGRLPETSAEDEARYSQAFTNIADYGVAHCGRVRGKLVP